MLVVFPATSVAVAVYVWDPTAVSPPVTAQPPFRRDRASEASQVGAAGTLPKLNVAPSAGPPIRRTAGRVLDQEAFGDHVGFLLEPIYAYGSSSDQGLTFQQSHDIQAGHPA